MNTTEKQNEGIPIITKKIWSKAKPLTVKPYEGQADCTCYLTTDQVFEIFKELAIPLDAVVRQGVPQPVSRAEDIEFIWSLIKDWAKEVPSESHSFDPMWFGTTTGNGDIEVHKRLCDILGKPYNIKTDSEQSA